MQQTRQTGNPARWLVGGRLLVSLLVIGSAVLRADAAVAQSNTAAQGRGPSGLPLPRFVSLKVSPVNLRVGPGVRYATSWVLRRAGMPLEVLREYDAWRQVRDAEGTTGWVLGSFLSGRRTAAVQPWNVKANTARPIIDLRASRSSTSRVVARIEAGTVVDIESCDGSWCNLWINDYSGFIRQTDLWGVYPGETVR
ncbi:MAG: SH3 domain-containing protein [Pseudomonadota bacterium]